MSCGEGDAGGAGFRALGRRRVGLGGWIEGIGGSGASRVIPWNVCERSIGVEAVRSMRGGVGFYVSSQMRVDLLGGNIEAELERLSLYQRAFGRPRD